MSYGTFLRDTSLDALVDRLDAHAWGAIPVAQAASDHDSLTSPAGDEQRTALAMLIAWGYSVTRLTASYLPQRRGARGQGSLVVVNARVVGQDNGVLEADLCRLAERFDYACILSAPAGGPLQPWWRKARNPRHDTPEARRAEALALDAYVTMIRQRQLAFDDCRPGTINGMRGMHALARQALGEGDLADE